MTNNFIKKHLLFLLPFLLIFSLASPVLAEQTLAEREEALQDLDEIECGVVTENGVDVVAPRSFSICKEDITYNSFYYMFSEIVNESDLLKRMLYEGDRDVFSNIAADTSGIAGPVMTVLTAVTYLVFIIASIILSYVTIKYLYRTATSGEFGGNWHSVWVPLRSLLAIMLIAPIGGVSIVQIIVLVAALIGAGVGNYLWGAFLNKFQMDAFIEGGEAEINRTLSYSQANTMVESQLCMDRTKKAVRKSSFFNTDDRETFLIDDYDIDDHARMLTECTDEALLYTKEGHSIEFGAVKSVELKSATKCAGYSAAGSVINWLSGSPGFDSEVYGEQYSCGFLSFNNPEPVNELSGLDMVEETAYESISDVVSFSDLSNNLGMLGNGQLTFFNSLRNDYSVKIENFVNSKVGNLNHNQILQNLKVFASDQIMSEESVDYGSETVKAAITDLANTLASGGETMYEELKLGTNQSAAVRGVFTAYTIMLNNMLGAQSEIDGAETQENRRFIREVNVPDAGDYIYRDFQKYSKASSNYLQAIHCLRHFSKNFGNVRMSKDMNDFIQAESEYDSWVAYTKSEGRQFSFECADFYFEGDVPENENVRVTTILEKTGDPDLISLVADYDSQDEADTEILKTQIENKGLELLRKAEIEKEALSLWFYVARQATEQAYAEVLKESVDTSVPINMRKQGFPTAGGYMLTIALNQVNASSFLSTMRSATQWGSNLGDSELFYNPSFATNIDGKLPIEEVNANGIEFSPMKIAGFFSSDNLSPSEVSQINSNDGTAEPYQQGFFDDFMKKIQNYVLSPTDHLKRAAGIPKDVTLKDGIEECYNEGNCSTGNIHPVNALIFFGNDLIEISVTMILTTFVVDTLNRIVDGDVQDKGTTKKGGGKVKELISTMLSFIPIIKGISIILTAAAVVLNLFAPLWYVLLIAGVFLSYILPTIPFITFILVYIGWIVLALELLIAAPIWLLLLAVPDQNGSGRASGMEVWNFFGLLIMKPAFMVIALAFAWFLASVSVYIVNATIFSVFAPVEESSSGLIMSIMNFVLFYLVYVVIVVIALLQAFKLISLLPDQMSKWINVRQSNDSSVVDSVSGDKLLQSVIVYQGLQRTSSGLGEFKNNINQKISRRKEQERSNDLRSHLQDIYEDDDRHARRDKIREHNKENLDTPVGTGGGDAGDAAGANNVGANEKKDDSFKEAIDKEHEEAYGPNGNSNSLRDNEAENVVDRSDPAENGAGSRPEGSEGTSDGDDKK
jgi:hypothetical protein